jgi:hypothetical protein
MAVSKASVSLLLKKLVVVALVAGLSGCAVWTRIDTATQEGPGNKYSVQAPIGWVRFNPASEGILITRDGVQIQYILIAQQKEDDFFKKTKVKLPKSVAASDLAQFVLAELRSDKELGNLEVKENIPFEVAGQPGFKVHFQYRNERGARFDRVVMGAAKDNIVTIMTYHGLSTHYFPRDLDTFYNVAKSFKAS